MTSKQQRILNMVAVQELIERLDCIPLVSKEEKYNKAVEVRVMQMMETFKDSVNRPAVKRTVVQSYEDWSKGPVSALKGRNEEIEGYLVSLYGKKPWKWPLTKAPF
jgi:hypothetical protein